METEDKTKSRKWHLVLLILAIVSIGTFLPPIVSLIFGLDKPLYILDGTHFVTIITLIVSAYYGANVLEKHVLKDQIIEDNVKKIITTSKENNTELIIKDNENGEI
jgi:hypothetical protein